MLLPTACLIAFINKTKLRDCFKALLEVSHLKLGLKLHDFASAHISLHGYRNGA